jgi:hypothetical protein
MTSVSRKRGSRCLVVVLAICATGCGGPGGSIKFGDATGTVTYQGRPVSGAIVTAYPETGPIASGLTDNEGKFTLSTGADQPGVAVGPVKVSVTKNIAAAVTPAAPAPIVGGTEFVDPSKTADMMRERQQNASSETTTPQSEIPLQYANPDTSGLKFEIKSGENDLPIVLQ